MFSVLWSDSNYCYAVLLVDSCRVKLYPRPGEEGSDYINASYIDVSIVLSFRSGPTHDATLRAVIAAVELRSTSSTIACNVASCVWA